MPIDNQTSTPVGVGAVTITRHLPCPLTLPRKMELLDEMSSHNQEYNRLERHKKELVDNTTKAMKHRKAQMDKISDTVAQGIEMKPIICRKEIDYIHGRITVIREDTGEVIEDRALEEGDMKQ